MKAVRVKRARGPVATGVVLLLVSGSVLFGWLDWGALGRWASGHGMGLALAAGGVALVVIGVVRGLVSGEAGRRAPLSWWVIAAGIALVGGVAWGATAWLLEEAGRSQDPAAARVDAVKTGLGIGAGTGGVLALLLAVRRQWHQEVTAVDTNHDATERRVTELYTKAAEQLGSDKAPVRLAGLYALERLAQDNPTQRQTIVNVLCAYLRMPYTLPGERPDTDTITDLRKELTSEHRDLTQEREVRLAAQRILAHHLRPGPNTDNPATTFWTNIDIDLTGATLIDLDLDACTIHTGNFYRATFTGTAWFNKTTFTGGAGFSGATFTDTAWFSEATFTGTAWFSEATFTGTAWFTEATFTGSARFRGATFTDTAWFNEAIFTGDAEFVEATFGGEAWFSETTFSGDARFSKATFDGDAGFSEATFTGDAWFGKATFTSEAWFEEATFTGDVRFSEATFNANTEFIRATLPTTCYVDHTTPSPWTDFGGARFEQGVPAEVVGFMSAPEDDGGRGGETG